MKAQSELQAELQAKLQAKRQGERQLQAKRQAKYEAECKVLIKGRRYQEPNITPNSDVPDFGDRVEFYWQFPWGSEWYAGVVTKTTPEMIRVEYDDKTFTDHPREGLKERFNWRHEDTGSQDNPHVGKGLSRGSGKVGEVNGVHFDQYERVSSDGRFYSKAKAREDTHDENIYTERRCAETYRESRCPSLQGYVGNDFVVPDDCEE